INSFTATFVLIGAVVYLILAPKGREDPATLSGSAAELLEPDSLDDDGAESEAEEEAETTEVDPPVVEVAGAADAEEPPASDESESADDPAAEPTGLQATQPNEN
ncbi:MAG: prolipoprotein diacylglyceryl transferase, partial [Mycobacterium sp.]